MNPRYYPGICQICSLPRQSPVTHSVITSERSRPLHPHLHHRSDGSLMACSLYTAINLFIGHLPASWRYISGCACVRYVWIKNHKVDSCVQLLCMYACAQRSIYDDGFQSESVSMCVYETELIIADRFHLFPSSSRNWLYLTSHHGWPRQIPLAVWLPGSRAHLGTGAKQVPSALYVKADLVAGIDEASTLTVCCPVVVKNTWRCAHTSTDALQSGAEKHRKCGFGSRFPYLPWTCLKNCHGDCGFHYHCITTTLR